MKQAAKQAILVEGLEVAFSGRTVLSDVAFDAGAKGLSVVVGRSGSGKTTLLRALNRLNETLPGCRTRGRHVPHGGSAAAVGAGKAAGRIAGAAPEGTVPALAELELGPAAGTAEPSPLARSLVSPLARSLVSPLTRSLAKSLARGVRRGTRG